MQFVFALTGPVARRADSRGVKSFLVHVKSLSASLSVLGLPPRHLAQASGLLSSVYNIKRFSLNKAAILFISKLLKTSTLKIIDNHLMVLFHMFV